MYTHTVAKRNLGGQVVPAGSHAMLYWPGHGFIIQLAASILERLILEQMLQRQSLRDGVSGKPQGLQSRHGRLTHWETLVLHLWQGVHY